MTTEERPARLHEAAVPPPEAEPPWHTAARHSAAPPPGVGPGVQGRRAGFVTRALANAVDLALVVTLLLLGYLAFAGIQFLAHPRSFHFPSPGLELLVPVGGLLLAAYFALSWTTVGRT